MLTQLRNYWASADKEEKSLKAMQKILKRIPEKTGVLKGYEGLCSMISAQFVFLPTSKLQLFLEGKKLLEEALIQAPDSLELHFMRFAVQRKTPAMLNYRENLASDKDFVIANLQATEDAHLRQFIEDYWKAEGIEG